MKLIFFSKCAKFYVDFENWKNIGKSFLALELMVFERVPGIYVNYDENTCDRQSTCYQTVVKFQISLKERCFLSQFVLD